MTNGYRVSVHWNLPKKCWSIADPGTGRVLLHLDGPILLESVKFKVSQAGRRRTLRERRRNVHAWAIGNLVVGTQRFSGRKLRYNPYIAGAFIDSAGRSVQGAALCWLGPDCLVKGTGLR